MTEIRTTYLFTIALTLDEIQLLGKTPLNRGEKADPSEHYFRVAPFFESRRNTIGPLAQ